MPLSLLQGTRQLRATYSLMRIDGITSVKGGRLDPPGSESNNSVVRAFWMRTTLESGGVI
jgi:hypothetical protein